MLRKIDQLIVIRIGQKIFLPAERKVDEMIAVLKITILLLIVVTSYAFYHHPRPLASLRLGSSGHFPEKSFIEQEFSKLSPSGALTYERFFQWNKTQALVDENLFKSNIFKGIWETQIGDVNSITCNLKQFSLLNELIDQTFNKMRDFNSKYITFWPDDVWEPSFNPLTILKPEYIDYLQTHFADYSTTTDQLSYNEFFNMNDIKGLIEYYKPNLIILNNLWTEAFDRTYYTHISIYNNTIAIHTLNEPISEYKDKSISFDSFVRLIIRLEDIGFQLSDVRLQLKQV